MRRDRKKDRKKKRDRKRRKKERQRIVRERDRTRDGDFIGRAVTLLGRTADSRGNGFAFGRLGVQSRVYCLPPIISVLASF